MKYFNSVFKSFYLCIFIVSVFFSSKTKAQCACTALQFTMDLTAAVNIQSIQVGPVRSGTSCCTNTNASQNCIKWTVLLNAGSDLLNFDVTTPGPPGGAFYQINCGPQISLNTPGCVNGQTMVCVTFCKSGGDQPNYIFTASRTFSASPNFSVRVGCSKTMTVVGLSAPSVTWTSISPGVPGQYNSYLSCPIGCTATAVTPTAPTPTLIAYRVAGSPATACPGTYADTVFVSVLPGLTVNITPTNAVVCSGGSGSVALTASVSGGAIPYTYTWSNGPNTSSVNVGIGNYTVLVNDNTTGCAAIPATVAVIPITTPSAPTLGNNSPLCIGSTLSLTATNSGGTTWNWTGPNSFTSSAQNPTIGAATTSASGTYSATMSFSGCTGPAGITNVTVSPVPSAPTAGSNSTLCAGTTLSLTATFSAGAIYNWTGPNSFTSNVQNPTIPLVTIAASGSYSVSATIGGCQGPIGTVNVTVNPIPVAPTAASNSTICAGSTLSLTANPGGAIYSWTGPNSFTSTAQNPTIGAATTSASGTYSVTQTLLGCTGPAGVTNVTVNPIPAAPTAASNSTICAGSTLSLTANPGGAIYSWNGPNSFTSTAQNPTIGAATTSASGTYSVTQTLLGCTGPAGVTNVTVNPIPAAPTAASNSTICAGSTLSLTATFTAGAVYNWTGPNTFTSNVQNPTIAGATTAASGIYSVSANINGCSGPIGTTNVTVNPIPAAPTAASNSTICAGSTLSLTANPGGAIYSWNGPNSFTSTAQNPTIGAATTSASGTYSVTQTLLGCTGPAGVTNVTVNPIPAAPTAASNSTICAGSTLSLTANPGGAIYNWTGPNSFTSTAQNPTIGVATTSASGTYSVTQTLLGCTGPAGVTNVTVNPIPAAPTAASNSSICAGSTLSLTANPGGAIYNWNGPNSFTSTAQNPTIGAATTSASGTYSVTQTLLGCTGPAGVTNVTVNPIPAAPTAASNSSICAGSTLSLTANPGGAIYNWNGPNSFTSTAQNPTIGAATTLASGTYSVTQTLLGCTGPAGVTNVTVNPIPAAPTAASNSTICAGSTLSLTTTFTAGAVYNWTGPNTFTSNVQNPTIAGATTAASGIYSVSANINGCSGPIGTTNVTVNPIPVAPTAASNSTICAGSTLSLTANPGGAIYSWNGPNSFTSTAQNPTIGAATTSASGTYSVTQTLLGCTGPAGVTNVTVNPIPAAPTAASNSTICAGSTLSLTATFTAGAVYNWTGPNTFTSNVQNPTIVAATTAASGIYSVSANINGCSGPMGTVNVTVNPIPAAPTAASNSTICAGSTLSLTANPGGAIYSWNGPNSFTSTAQNPTIGAATTLASGTYSVTQTLLGCTGPAGVTNVTVNPIPAAPTAASNSTICAGSTLSLTANPGGAIYSWNGPNSFTSTAQNPTIGAATTSASGTYSVTQTLLGCTGPAGVTNVTVNPIPSAPTAASNSTLCAGSTLSLTANPGGAIYNWTGPNTFTSNVQNPTIVGATTLASGTYSVTQTLLGCTGPAGVTNVTINPIPTAPIASSNSTICAGSTLSLTSTFSAGATYSWTGPNTFTSNIQNPTIVGASTLASGTYSIAMNIGGCQGPTGTTNVTVNPIPAAPTAASNSTICAGSTLSLTANPGGAVYNWNGPNSFTSTAQNPTIAAATTSASGTYSVTQTLLGCTGPAGVTNVTVNPIPSAPTAASNSTICAGSTLSLTATFTAGAVYNWTGPNTFTSNVQNPTIVGASTLASGTYSVFADIGGCSGPLGTVDVTVNPIPAAPTAANNSTICAGLTLSLTANPGGAIYNWTGPNTFTSNLQNPTIAGATTLATGMYSVTQTLLGCTSPAGTTSVTIVEIPSAANASSNSTLCAGSTLSLTASFTAGAVYNWFGPNSFTSTAQNPTISPVTTSASGVYTVFVGLAGCTGPTVTINVLINPIPAAPTAANNSTICAGSTLSLTANPGGAIYNWTGPNSFTSSVQNPTIPGATTLATGDYSVTQTVLGCTGPEGITSVTINPIPNAPTGISNSPVCSFGALIFTLSPAGGTYSWTGPNSFTSTVQNPTINPAPFAATGNYSVTITLLGCTSPFGIVTASVGIAPNSPDINVNTPLCVGSTVSLSATFSAGVNFNWTGPNSFTSNVQNPVITPASTLAAGVYTVVGNINGCDGPPSTLTVVVDTPAFVDAGKRQDTICSSALIVTPLNGTVTGGGNTGCIWSTLGSGTFSPTNSLTTTYTMSPADMAAPFFDLIITSQGGGCPNQNDTIRYIVLGPPLIDVGLDLNICKNAFVTLTATITGVTNTGTWTSTGSGTFTPNFGSLNGTYIPSSADTASGPIKLVLESTNNKGCQSVKDSLLVTFIPSPIADFISSIACATKPLNFTDQSAPSPSIASYSWDFRDGIGTSTAANPTYTYASGNTYTVQHIVTLINGCKDTVEKPVTVFISPLANFTASNVCVGNQSLFFDSSSVDVGSLIKWNWNFGDGGTDTLTNPLHLYTNTGPFAVNFTVTSSNGCSTSATKTVIVRPRPTANFNMSATTILAYDNVSFTDQSTTTPPATLASWSWNFGNSVTSTDQNPSNFWTDKGIYPVTLAIRDNFGCADTVKKDIVVTLLPLVPTAFTPNGDGHNDVLFVKGGPFVKMSFRVYNNWGELLFVSDDQEKGWDGKYKGQPAPLGVYVWILDVDLYNGQSVRKTGDITILK